MTVTGIENDCVRIRNIMKSFSSERLQVVISNPCQYAKQYILVREFTKRLTLRRMCFEGQSLWITQPSVVAQGKYDQRQYLNAITQILEGRMPTSILKAPRGP